MPGISYIHSSYHPVLQTGKRPDLSWLWGADLATGEPEFRSYLLAESVLIHP